MASYMLLNEAQSEPVEGGKPVTAGESPGWSDCSVVYLGKSRIRSPMMLR